MAPLQGAKFILRDPGVALAFARLPPATVCHGYAVKSVGRFPKRRPDSLDSPLATFFHGFGVNTFALHLPKTIERASRADVNSAICNRRRRVNFVVHLVNLQDLPFAGGFQN